MGSTAGSAPFIHQPVEVVDSHVGGAYFGSNSREEQNHRMLQSVYIKKASFQSGKMPFFYNLISTGIRGNSSLEFFALFLFLR